jgi:hypothetical protein
MYMIISNVYVDLILRVILYVMFRTAYVLDKFYIQWLLDVESLIILQSVECLLEQRQKKGKVREALVSDLGAKFLLFTQSHIYYSRKLYINSQSVSCNIFQTRDSFCSSKYFICVWSEIVVF